MKCDRNKHHRRSIRLPGYDYRQPGAYFVTICADRRQCLFGDIVDGGMVLNQYGAIVTDTYRWLCQRYPYLYTDEWIVMPNHFHAIVVITDKPRRGVSRLRSTSEGETPLQCETPVRQMNNEPSIIHQTQPPNANHWGV